jgi:nucleoside-diphosphate-sugar epimerase
MIKNGRMPLTRTAENRRSMAYVDNICHAILRCENSPATHGQTYWIADERPYSMQEIVDTVSRLLRNEFGMTVADEQVRLPSMVFECAQLLDGIIQRTGLYNQKIHVLSEMNKTIACSIAKAKSDFNYEPHIELEEGMRRSIAALLRQGVAI